MKRIAQIAALYDGFRAQEQALRDFHSSAARFLGALAPGPDAPPEALRFENNFFSALFLSALQALKMPPRRLPLYGLVNQCMRAWVTACDNLLDAEDRAIFRLNLPGKGYRFKAVLTIMASERVLSERLLRAVASGELSCEQAVALEKESLAALVASGVQEHGEEEGVSEILPPSLLLESIHAVKTGRLFEAPVMVAERMGEISGAAVASMRQGLHAFGLGCQILDDMADVERDVMQSRHNYVLSELAAQSCAAAIARVKEAALAGQDPRCMLESAMERSSREAQRRMTDGLLVMADAGLSLNAAERKMICAAMFPLLLTKDAPSATDSTSNVQ